MRVLLTDRGENLGEYDWPAVPRVGETVIYGFPEQAHKAYKVVEVVWDATGTGPFARVHLEQS